MSRQPIRYRRSVVGVCGSRSRSARTLRPSPAEVRLKPRHSSTVSAAALVVVVSARTALAPSAAASSSTAAIAARPTPRPRTGRVSQAPISSMPCSSVRFSRTDPTTRPPITTAQVASRAGPPKPGRRSRWKPRSQATRVGVQASPAVSGGVTSSAAASLIAACTSWPSTTSSTAASVTEKSSSPTIPVKLATHAISDAGGASHCPIGQRHRHPHGGGDRRGRDGRHHRPRPSGADHPRPWWLRPRAATLPRPTPRATRRRPEPMSVAACG